MPLEPGNRWPNVIQWPEDVADPVAVNAVKTGGLVGFGDRDKLGSRREDRAPEHPHSSDGGPGIDDASVSVSSHSTRCDWSYSDPKGGSVPPPMWPVSIECVNREAVLPGYTPPFVKRPLASKMGVTLSFACLRWRLNPANWNSSAVSPQFRAFKYLSQRRVTPTPFVNSRPRSCSASARMR